MLFRLVTLSIASNNWTAFTKGRVFEDNQCRDIGNPGGLTNISCQALCDQTPSCTAINAIDTGGACALRACPCGQKLAPGGSNNKFHAYIRTSCNDGRAPARFANIFQSDMVLQRAPEQARLFGTAAPLANLTLMITLPKRESSILETNIQADSTGRWAYNLPATGAGGPYNLQVAPKGIPNAGQTLSGVLFGDVIICSGQSNMVCTVSSFNVGVLHICAICRWKQCSLSTTPLQKLQPRLHSRGSA